MQVLLLSASAVCTGGSTAPAAAGTSRSPGLVQQGPATRRKCDFTSQKHTTDTERSRAENVEVHRVIFRVSLP